MPRPFRTRSVRDLGPQFTQNPHAMIGQDGAFSVPTSHGLLFYFGDTVLGSRASLRSLWFPDGMAIGNRPMSDFGNITGMLTTTALLTPQTEAGEGVREFEYLTDAEGRIRQIIPDHPGQTHDHWRNWCLHGIQLGDKVYLYYIKVQMLNDGFMPVNFRIHGSGLAVGAVDDLKFELVDGPHEGLFWTHEEPMFANSVLDGRDGFLYVYGVRKMGRNQRCFVARVKPAQIEDRSAYRYWDGDGWSDDTRDAIPVMGGMPNEMSVSWNEWLGCWLAVNSYSTHGRIVAQTADHPWGPWSKPKDLHHVELEPHGLPYPTLIYAGKEHPALSRENGRILAVTYIEFEEYYPHLLEIELEETSRRKGRQTP